MPAVLKRKFETETIDAPDLPASDLPDDLYMAWEEMTRDVVPHKRIAPILMRLGLNRKPALPGDALGDWLMAEKELGVK